MKNANNEPTETDDTTRSAEARSVDVQRVGSCRWKYDEWHCCYDTGCKNAYCFDYEFTAGGSYKYCPGCGQQIAVTQQDGEAATAEAHTRDDAKPRSTGEAKS